MRLHHPFEEMFQVRELTPEVCVMLPFYVIDQFVGVGHGPIGQHVVSCWGSIANLLQRRQQKIDGDVLFRSRYCQSGPLAGGYPEACQDRSSLGVLSQNLVNINGFLN